MPKRSSADIDYQQFKETFIEENPGLYHAMLHYTDHILPMLSDKESRASLSAHTGISTKRLKEIYRRPFTISLVETHTILHSVNKKMMIRRPNGTRSSLNK